LDSETATRTGAGNDVEAVLEEEKVSLLAELWDFLRTRKKFWLMPIVFVMLLLGALLIFAQGTAVAPFIYTLF
jgi:hypothetical protein